MAKTAAQLDKRKRDTEKRKKLEKVIKRIAAEMPEPAAEPRPNISGDKAPEGPGVKCLRCGGVGHLIADCDKCKGRGVMVVSCRKCSGQVQGPRRDGGELPKVLGEGRLCPEGGAL